MRSSPLNPRGRSMASNVRWAGADGLDKQKELLRTSLRDLLATLSWAAILRDMIGNLSVG
ncbi:hypothetical protein Aab01nite_16940 [Paractinoplanes abujensis]|nr:hypothetical protein Aab01nite_16940 [Actinoplanes abujensis]